MSIVNLLDTVTAWAQTNICNEIKLKQPPVDLDAPTDAGYDYKLVNPAAFAMYVPTSEKLPPNVHAPFPSLCVRFMAGQDEPANGAGFVDLQFCFSTWDTGLHGPDFFQRNGEGWRDAWNFVDKALREVESVTDIGGFVVDRVEPIKFGPLTEQESIPDLYPTWFAWISFRVNYPLMRNNQSLQNFL